MARVYNNTVYGSAKGILMFPDHYVGIGVVHAKAVSGDAGLAV